MFFCFFQFQMFIDWKMNSFIDCSSKIKTVYAMDTRVFSFSLHTFVFSYTSLPCNQSQSQVARFVGDIKSPCNKNTRNTRFLRKKT